MYSNNIVNFEESTKNSGNLLIARCQVGNLNKEQMYAFTQPLYHGQDVTKVIFSAKVV